MTGQLKQDMPPKKRGRKPKQASVAEKTGVTGFAAIDLKAAIDPTHETGGTISLFDDEGKRKAQATLLIEIGANNALFHCDNKDGYAQVKTANNKLAVMALKSKDFKDYLGHEYFKLTGKGCNANAVTDALSTLESIAKYNNPMYPVFTRVANQDGRIYLDMGCGEWRAIEITAHGWRILEQSPVKFIRKRGAAALPEPSRGGDISLLGQYINVDSGQLPLVIGWLLCALAGVKPYPILILQGEQGTGKSTTSRVLRSLVDPSTVPLRSPPKDPRDLLVSAGNNHVVVLDNLSGLSPELSDCLCRLSTGGGIDVRALYTDNEQVLIDIQRPILINGIDDVATRPDLAERALIINLPVIEGGNRKGERGFWQAFEADKPLIFGALLDALVSGLAHVDSIVLPYRPRMADVAQWVAACERGLWEEGRFMAAHERNQNEAIEMGLESSPIGSAIMALMSEHDRWTGKPTALLTALAGIAGDSQVRSKAWPQSPKGLSNAIKRLMPSLRKIGISIQDTRTAAAREYKIQKSGSYPSYPSQASLNGDNPERARGSAMTDRRDPMTDSPIMTDSVTDSIYPMTDIKTPQATDGAGYDAYDRYDAYNPALHVSDDDKGRI